MLEWYIHQLNNPSPLRRTFSITVLIAIIFFSILVILKVINPYPLKGWIYLRLYIEDLGLLGVLIFISMVAIFPLFSPLSILIITGTLAYGNFFGMILCYVGLVLNANITYFIVKALSIDRAWGDGKWPSTLRNTIQRHGYPIVLFLQLITVIPFVLVNTAACAAGVSWRTLMKATCIGVLPTVFIFTFLGHSVISKMLSPELYVSSISVAALCLILLAVRERYPKNAGKATD